MIVGIGFGATAGLTHIEENSAGKIVPKKWSGSYVPSAGPEPRRERRTTFERILGQTDTMLGKYMRAQLALAGLSLLFYSTSMLVLGFPYSLALGALGGVVEFLPTVGWIASAVMILTIGFHTHSHWVGMTGRVVVWRIVLNYVDLSSHHR